MNRAEFVNRETRLLEYCEMPDEDLKKVLDMQERVAELIRTSANLEEYRVKRAKMALEHFTSVPNWLQPENFQAWQARRGMATWEDFVEVQAQILSITREAYESKSIASFDPYTSSKENSSFAPHA